VPLKKNNTRITQVSRNASLSTGPFTHKAGKAAQGWNLFCRATLSLVYPVMQKNSYALAPRTTRQLSLLLPEAYLLTGSEKLLIFVILSASERS